METEGKVISTERDFSLRRPADSRERNGKEKADPSLSLGMTGRCGIGLERRGGSWRRDGQDGRVATAKIRRTAASAPRPTGVVVWTLRTCGERVERQGSS